MTRQMSCGESAERLSEYLERELDDATRAAMDRHVLSCAVCGALVADLRELRTQAAKLPELAPSRDLWSGIVSRIETPVVELNPARGAATVEHDAPSASRSARRIDRRVWLGLAAAALVGITATVTHEVTKRSVSATIPAVRMASVPVDSANSIRGAEPESGAVGAAGVPVDAARTRAPKPAGVSLVSNGASKPTAEQTYDREITVLRTIVAKRQSELDSSTVAVIAHNLHIIDDAIAQCRSALKKDPNSRFLMQSLDDALDTKLQLMRTVAMLPARS